MSAPDQAVDEVLVPSVIAVLCGLVVLAAVIIWPDERHDAEEDLATEVSERLLPAIVSLSSADPTHSLAPPSSSPTNGLGLIVDRDGMILTAARVADGRSSMTATLFTGQRVTATVIARDPDTDIAVLRLLAVRHIAPPPELGDSDRLCVGQRTLAVGGVGDLGFTVTSGFIVGLGRESGDHPGLIRITAALPPASSGGPLIDEAGRVIGIMRVPTDTERSSDATPINAAKRIMAGLRGLPCPQRLAGFDNRCRHART
jgi:S1-C subfamily serine protease